MNVRQVLQDFDTHLNGCTHCQRNPILCEAGSLRLVRVIEAREEVAFNANPFAEEELMEDNR